MGKDLKKLINDMLMNLEGLENIAPEDFPNIDLYMDQVTTFMDSQLGTSKRFPDDKVLTKTMINNYAKNDLFPSPEKKRYTKAHLQILVFIYYLKSFLFIRDIQKLLNPLVLRYFGKGKEKDVSYVYKEIYQIEKDMTQDVTQDILKTQARVSASFSDASPEEQEYLQRFALVSALSYDVYLKKRLIETLIDDMPQEP